MSTAGALRSGYEAVRTALDLKGRRPALPQAEDAPVSMTPFWYGRTILTPANGAGHRVPGLVGRSFAFTARLLGSEGDVVAEAELVLDTRRQAWIDSFYPAATKR